MPDDLQRIAVVEYLMDLVACVLPFLTVFMIVTSVHYSIYVNDPHRRKKTYKKKLVRLVAKRKGASVLLRDVKLSSARFKTWMAYYLAAVTVAHAAQMESIQDELFRLQTVSQKGGKIPRLTVSTPCTNSSIFAAQTWVWWGMFDLLDVCSIVVGSRDVKANRSTRSSPCADVPKGMDTTR